MNKLILHKGNTKEASDNSLESLCILDENTKHKLKVCNDIIYEYDVIAKYPFIIYHDTHVNIKNIFETNIDKFMYQLTKYDIYNLPEYNKQKIKHTLMCLDELLEIAKRKNIKLYLDIKSPYNNLLPMSKKNKAILHQDLLKMCELIGKYDNIDCVISFTPCIEKYMHNYFNNNTNIKLGVFINEEKLFSKKLNYYYQKTKLEKYKPLVISIEYKLLQNKQYLTLINDYKDKCNNINVYTWTLHKDTDINIFNMLHLNNITPVIDMFDSK